MMNYIHTLKQLTQSDKAFATLFCTIKSDLKEHDFKFEDDAILIHFYGSDKANHCKIVYDNVRNLYYMSFYNKLNDGQMKQIVGVDGLKSGQLKGTFEQITGLCLDASEIDLKNWW